MIREVLAMVLVIKRELRRNIYLVEVGSTAWAAIHRDICNCVELPAGARLTLHGGTVGSTHWAEFWVHECSLRIVEMDTMFPNDIRFEGGRV